MPASPSWPDRLIAALDQGLRAAAGPAGTGVPAPGAELPETALSADDRRRSAALMRVNHAGEIAAQALYNGQALMARSDQAQHTLESAAREERDHLAWCAGRIEELGGRTSLLTPFWYAGSFCLGVVAGTIDDAHNLGFVRETERQVETHLHDHLARLPEGDRKSAAILQRMAQDEARHGAAAGAAGGAELPKPVRVLMGVGGEILRRVALIV